MKTWFHVQIPAKLANILQDIVDEYSAREKEDREALLDDLALTLANGYHGWPTA